MHANRIFTPLAALFLILFFMSSPAFAQTPGPLPPGDPPVQQALIDTLRTGGYVIYFSHTHADPSRPDLDLARCDRQSNLDAEGRSQAEAIGAEFRRLRIPVARVFADVYCRTQETARLAFGRAEVAGNFVSDDALLTRMLGTPPQAGTNTVIVAHASTLDRLARISLAEGEAALLQPAGDGEFHLMGRVLAGRWRQFSVSR